MHALDDSGVYTFLTFLQFLESAWCTAALYCHPTFVTTVCLHFCLSFFLLTDKLLFFCTLFTVCRQFWLLFCFRHRWWCDIGCQVDTCTCCESSPNDFLVRPVDSKASWVSPVWDDALEQHRPSSGVKGTVWPDGVLWHLYGKIHDYNWNCKGKENNTSRNWKETKNSRLASERPLNATSVAITKHFNSISFIHKSVREQTLNLQIGPCYCGESHWGLLARPLNSTSCNPPQSGITADGWRSVICWGNFVHGCHGLSWCDISCC